MPKEWITSRGARTGISVSISSQHRFNRAGGRPSNFLQEMEYQSTSPRVTTDPASREVSPHRAILASSLFFGICSIACLRYARSDSFLFAVGLGLLLVCVLPWLVVLRRIAWNRRYPEGGRWMIAVAALLWISLLIGPVVTGSFWLWTQFSDAPDGMARFSEFSGLVGFGVISFSAAYWLAALAFLIQIWRDQWRMKLTGVTVAFLFLLFVAYAWLVTLPSKPREKTSREMQPAITSIVELRIATAGLSTLTLA